MTTFQNLPTLNSESPEKSFLSQFMFPKTTCSSIHSVYVLVHASLVSRRSVNTNTRQRVDLMPRTVAELSASGCATQNFFVRLEKRETEIFARL